MKIKQTNRLRAETGTEHLEARELLSGSRGGFKSKDRRGNKHCRDNRDEKRQSQNIRQQERQVSQKQTNSQAKNQSPNGPEAEQKETESVQATETQAPAVSGFNQTVVAVGSDTNGDGTL